MKNIKLNNATFKSADNIINEIENRARKQSRFYTILFVVITAAVAIFVLDRISVKEYEGYISHRDITMRAVNNMSIVDYYVKPGDIVNEGDTLYSQLMIDWLEDQANPFSNDIANEKIIESDLRIAKYESDAIEIDNTIDSLQSAIKSINKEILSGVKTADARLDLNLGLIERVEKSKHIQRAIDAEYEFQSKYDRSVKNHTTLISQGASERKANLDLFGGALRYRVAYVDSKIVNIKASIGMMTLKHEDVLTFQPIGHPNMTNTHINMIVEADEYGDLFEGMEVQVHAGGHFLCDANISMLGVRMADAYSNIESILDRSTDLNGKLIVALKFKDGYKLPDEFYINNYPVEIRHRVWGDKSSFFNVKEWFN